MTKTVMKELCFLLELLGYCVLGLLPALVSVWVGLTPVVSGIGLFVSYHLIDNFTPQQLFWVYAIAGLIWWICGWYCEYTIAVQATNLRGQLKVPSFKSWCIVKILAAFAQSNGNRLSQDKRELLVLDTILKAAIWYASKGELSPVDQGAKRTRPTCQPRMRLQRTTVPLQTPPIPSNEEDAEAPDDSQSIKFPDHQIWAMPDTATRWPDDMEALWLQPTEQPEQPSSQHR